MIVTSKGYKSEKAFKTVVNYVLRENEGKVLLKRFLSGKELSAQAISQQFYLNEQYRIHQRKNTVKLYMDILSFHKDNAKDLTDAKLKKIGREYLKLRAPNAISIVTAHRDTEQTHLHVLMGIQYKTGKSIRMSKSDFQNKVKLPIESFVRKNYPELERSAIQHFPSKKKSN